MNGYRIGGSRAESVALLGAVEVYGPDGPLAIGGRQPRLVLATLALASPEPVTVDGLIDALWDEPPTSAVKTVRSIVSRLRGALGVQLIESTRSGYRLVLPTEAVDAHRLEHLTAKITRDKVDETQIDAELASLSGEPFGPLHLSSRLGGEKTRLVELQHALRELVAERWIEKLDHSRAVPFAEELVAENPLSEKRWELLARALAGAGRRGEALRSVQRARESLVAQLGIEPGERLRMVEQAILADRNPDTNSVDGSSGRARPRDLPAEIDTACEGDPPRHVRGALPRRESILVGRERDLAAVGSLLAEGALVSVVGPGGVGKTSLALEIGRQLSHDWRDGVWFCDLAAITDSSAVARVVAATMNVPQQEGRDPVQSLLEAVESDSSLIILDNCEHVASAVAQLAQALVERCPRVCVLATSRERLELAAETVAPLEPLDPSTAGVELFDLRALQSDPDYEPGDHRGDVVELCVKLDGLPLAIELAAARTRSLAPAELVRRMGDRFELLKARRRDVHPRHRTLRAMVTWSHDLLRSEHRQLFHRLSVFAGWFDLDAALQICADGELDELTVVDGMQDLVDQFLVVSKQHPEGVRYRLLETLRQFGAERLSEHQAAGQVGRRHATYFARRAQQAHDLYEGPHCPQGVVEFEFIWDNVREATRWALANAEPALLEDLLDGSAWFAYFSGRDEVGDWATQASSLVRSPLFLGIAASFALNAGEYERATALGAEGVAAAPYVEHPMTDFCHWALEVAAMHAGKPDDCVAHMNHHEEAAEASQDHFSLALCHGARLVWIAATRPKEGLPYARIAIESVAASGSQSLSATINVYLAGLYQANGDVETAARYRDLAIDDAKATGNRRVHSLALAWRAVRTPETDRDRRYLETLLESRELRDWMAIQVTLESLAGHLVSTEPRLSARLLGYLENHGIGFGGLARRRTATLEHIKELPEGDLWLSEGSHTSRSALLEQVISVLEARRTIGC